MGDKAINCGEVTVKRLADGCWVPLDAYNELWDAYSKAKREACYWEQRSDYWQTQYSNAQKVIRELEMKLRGVPVGAVALGYKDPIQMTQERYSELTEKAHKYDAMMEAAR